MKKSIINGLVLSALAITPMISTVSYAEQASYSEQISTELTPKRDKEIREEIGFGSGALVGAIFGGPVGAFVTGIAGTFIAKHYNANEDVEMLTAQVNQQQQQQQQLASQYQRQLKQAEQEFQQELLALQQSNKLSQLQAENLLMSLQFSTGSSDIASHYQAQIEALAKIIKANSGLSIDLSGYTDLQGDEALNQNLSLARVNSVKNALIDKGVTPERINIYAFGESEPVVANAQREVSFYDRRVVVKVHSDLNQVAKN